MWKEVVVPSGRFYLCIFLEVLRKLTKNLRLAGDTVEDRGVPFQPPLSVGGTI